MNASTSAEANTPAPLGPEYRVTVEAALARIASGSGERCLSDHAWANLYLFRRPHDYRYIGGPWPRISGLTYDGERHLLPLFPLASAPLQTLQEMLHNHDCFYPLAEREANGMDACHFQLDDHRDDADYLYPAAQFRHYGGRVLRKKRNLLQQLLAAHQVQSMAYGRQHRTAAVAILDGWMIDKAKAAGDADDLACREALQRASEMGLEGFIYQADGIPAGFLLAQEIQPGVFAIRFAKGLQSFKGIAQYMFHHFACTFHRPVHWLNFEQDLGLANFRHTKMSYQPSALLRKFRARIRV